MSTFEYAVEGCLAAVCLGLLLAWASAFRRYRLVRRERQSERDQLDSWIESSPVGLIVFNEAREIVRLNAEAARLLRGEALEFFGKRQGEALQCAHWKESPKGCGYGSHCLTCPLRKAVSAVLGEGKSVRAHVIPMTLARDGLVKKVWLRIGAQPLLLAKRSHVVLSIDDVTESVQAAERLKGATEELERLNAKIQRASEAKGRFLAHMSHEIRTPLNGIVGMTDLLASTELSAQQQELVRHLRSSSEILLDVVNGVLDFSKLEADKMTLANKEFNLHDCLEEVAQIVGPAASKKRLELVFRVDPGLRPVWVGDALRLRQILVNLVANAVKFTERGEVVVAVEGTAGAEDEPRLCFEVRDTGIGISSEQQRKLFEPFSQTDGSEARRAEGTGLGLTISKQLCALMGGAIAVESSGVPGRGSVFRFFVKVQPGGGPAASDGSVAHVSLPGKRVLVADDNATSCDALSRQLASWGMTVQSAGSGSAALGIVKSGAPVDLALVDRDLLDMGGLALAKAIAGLRPSERVRVVLLCPQGEETLSGECRVAGVGACVAKPVNPRRLHDALVATLAQSRTAADAGLRGALAPTAAAPRAPLRILVAEDNLVNQKVVLGFLAHLGYSADVVANGRDAWEAVQRRIYDLVLLDGQMPEMDGDKVAETIRKELPVARQPWIVAMTANALKGDREHYLASGMNDYLSKPVRPDQLRDALSRVPVVPG